MKKLLALSILFCLLFIQATSAQVPNKEDLPDYLNGSSYYPEQWPESRWEEDFQKMKEIGFNVVRMGEFAWSHFEPSPGEFNFEWMDKAIDLAEKYDLKVVLCTPTASMPPWLITNHADVLSGNDEGRYDQGVRKGHNTNSSSLTLASDRIVKAMAEHYGDNPNIIGWQLDNEPGYPFLMYDEGTKEAFQEWLRNRYSDIDELNKEWWNVFWSMEYRNFDEIPLPPLNRADGIANPSHHMEYRRFYSDSFLALLKRQEEILRKHIGNRFIFTNWPNTSWSLNLYDASKFIDFNGWDNYSPEPGMGDYRMQYFTGMHHDLCRNAVPDQYYIVSEQPAQAPAVSTPEAVRLKTYTNIAHGARGTVYFEWRSPLGSSEQGYVSVLQLDGSFGPSKEQFHKMNSELERIIPQLENTKVKADMALIYSYDNQWQQGWWIKSSPEGYDKEALRYYQGMKILKKNIDVISEYSDLSKYEIVVAPGLEILNKETAEKFISFVKNGGVLVVNRNPASKDTFSNFYEINPPGLFKEMAKIEVPWIKDHIRGDNKFDFRINFNDKYDNFKPRTFIKEIRLNGAEAIADFQGGFVDKQPAVTINSFGKGQFVYVGSDCADPSFYEAIFKNLEQRFNYLPILDAPESVEVVSRETDDQEIIFCLNQDDKEAVINLNESMKDLITNKKLDGEVIVPPMDVRVFVRKK